MKTKKSKPNIKKARKQRLIVTTVAVGAAGVLGYFGWQYLKKKKQSRAASGGNSFTKVGSETPIDYSELTAATANTNSSSGPSKPRARKTPTSASAQDFPLKKGSKGEKVRALQQAIIAQYGPSSLPKYGADGAFGTELASFLKKAGFPASVSESMFNVLTKQSGSESAESVGSNLVNAVKANDFKKTIALLKSLKSTQDYRAANNIFKQERIAGVRQTLVTGLLNTFTSEANKQAIRREFLRMGLQFDGNKWSLSVVDGPSIVTTTGTNVWVDAQTSIPVPARMVLGAEVSRRLDYTLFENKGRYFLVQSSHVQPLR